MADVKEEKRSRRDREEEHEGYIGCARLEGAGELGSWGASSNCAARERQ
jgi:hypothetical protein